MKRVLSICLAVAFVTVNALEAYAVTKEGKKSAQQQAKELKKKGWQSEDENTIEYGFILIQEQKEQGKDRYMGTSYDSQTASVAKQHARQDVFNQLTENGRSVSKARIKQEIGDVKGEEHDNLMSAYDRIAQVELDNVVHSPVMTIKLGDTPQYRCYYMIDPVELKRCYNRILEKAVDEAGMRNKLAKKIDNFIDGNYDED